MKIKAEGNPLAYRVLLDGVDVTNDIYEADDEEGIVRGYARNVEGNRYIIGKDHPDIRHGDDPRGPAIYGAGFGKVAEFVGCGRVQIIHPRIGP